MRGMKIDGKALANDILSNLKAKVSALKEKGVTPKMVVILVGNDPASASYVRQKEKAATAIGADLQIMKYADSVSQETITEAIKSLNSDPTVHGIIVQLPLPPHFDVSIDRSVDPKKDVDGFVPHSKFEVPIALATEKILNAMYAKQPQNGAFNQWLKRQHIVVIGRGETGGKPIASSFRKEAYDVSVIHSQTPEGEKQRLLNHADIVISCVGKPGIVQKEYIKKGAILISVGIWRDTNGIFHGDYEEDDIKDIASFYTPTPKGIGPVNVACLMENLVTAASEKAS